MDRVHEASINMVLLFLLSCILFPILYILPRGSYFEYAYFILYLNMDICMIGKTYKNAWIVLLDLLLLVYIYSYELYVTWIIVRFFHILQFIAAMCVIYLRNL